MCAIVWIAGMHKKSIEAQHKIKADDSPQDVTHPDISRERRPDSAGTKDVRSESIATLRAKALEHCAKITQQERRFSDHMEDNRGETIDTDLSHYSSVFSHPSKETEINVTVP